MKPKFNSVLASLFGFAGLRLPEAPEASKEPRTRTFAGQRSNPRRNAERRLTKAIGSRQARRQTKTSYRLKREAMGVGHED